jgi:hypothetical protein
VRFNILLRGSIERRRPTMRLQWREKRMKDKEKANDEELTQENCITITIPVLRT